MATVTSAGSAAGADTGARFAERLANEESTFEFHRNAGEDNLKVRRTTSRNKLRKNVSVALPGGICVEREWRALPRNGADGPQSQVRSCGACQ